MFKSIATEQLDQVTGAASGDFPGFNGCGKNFFSKGCVDGGMSFNEWSSIAYGGKMGNGKTATFDRWAGWMRQHHYPSAALDRAGR